MLFAALHEFAFGTKQTSVCVASMSALEVKRAMDTSSGDESRGN